MDEGKGGTMLGGLMDGGIVNQWMEDGRLMDGKMHVLQSSVNSWSLW